MSVRIFVGRILRRLRSSLEKSPLPIKPHRPTGSTGVLILGEVFADKKPQFIQPFFGDDAYEIVTVAGYMRELLMVRNTDYLCSSQGFRYFYPVLSFLSKTNQTVRFEEIGSTLYSTIDKIRKSEREFGKLGFNSISFYGIEVSDLLINSAIALHPDEKIHHFKTWGEIPLEPSLAVGRSYQATSYAFKSTVEFANWLTRFRFSVHGAWFSMDGPEKKIRVLSNDATLFNLDLLTALLNERGHRLYIISSQRYKMTEDSYVLSWFVVENFSDVERSALADHLKEFDNFITEKADLTRPYVPAGDRGAIVDHGTHCGALFPQDERYCGDYPKTFDFSSLGMEQRFLVHLSKIQGEQ